MHCGKTASLFDHLVGAGEQCGRHLEAKRLGSFEVDEELDLRCLLDRQVGCPLTFEYPAGIAADLTERVGKAAPSLQPRRTRETGKSLARSLFLAASPSSSLFGPRCASG
jgi:hypothetical protein